MAVCDSGGTAKQIGGDSDGGPCAKLVYTLGTALKREAGRSQLRPLTMVCEWCEWSSGAGAFGALMLSTGNAMKGAGGEVQFEISVRGCLKRSILYLQQEGNLRSKLVQA
jgi:hypothetical protein